MKRLVALLLTATMIVSLTACGGETKESEATDTTATEQGESSDVDDKLTPAVYLNVAKTSGASRWEIFWTVSKNYAMPLAFTGVQVALGNAWSTLVASELLAATAGLGYMIQQGRSLVRPDIIIVGMLTIGVIGAILTTLLSKLENHVVKWRSRG